jgi:hypothetical protein
MNEMNQCYFQTLLMDDVSEEIEQQYGEDEDLATEEDE